MDFNKLAKKSVRINSYFNSYFEEIFAEPLRKRGINEEQIASRRKVFFSGALAFRLCIQKVADLPEEQAQPAAELLESELTSFFLAETKNCDCPACQNLRKSGNIVDTIDRNGDQMARKPDGTSG